MATITLDFKIAEEIKCYIQDNNLSANTKLPSERKLAELFKVNRMTLRSALQRLINEGCLIKKQNKGYYIAEEKIRKNITSLKTLDSLCDSNNNNISFYLHSVELIELNKILSQKMKETIGTRVYRILHILKHNEKIAAIQCTYVKQKMLLSSNSKKMTATEIEKNYQAQIHSSEEEIYIEKANSFEQSFLNINSNEIVAKQSGLLFNQKNEIISYREIVMLLNQFKFIGWWFIWTIEYHYIYN